MESQKTNYQINVVSYNILSPNLIQAHSHQRDPKYLNANYRISLIKSELLKFIESQDIICLQEVSEDWYQNLLVFFSKNNYTICWAKGDTYFSGFMGPAIAWPQILTLENIKIVKPAKYIPKCPKVDTYYSQWTPTFLKSRIQNMSWFKSKFEPYVEEKNKVWSWACSKKNDAIIATFSYECTITQQRKEFIIATYHMPCAFKHPQLMVLHSAALLHAINNEQDDKPIPIILGGDFNMQQNSDPYNVIEGNIDFLYNVDWSQELIDFIKHSKSDLKCAYDPLPLFTNRALFKIWSPEPETFEGTIDFIFYSKELTVKDTMKLVTINDLPEPKFIPSIGFPSDHLPIRAVFESIIL